jgi:peptide/nickel transport system substrate-binding protein
MRTTHRFTGLLKLMLVLSLIASACSSDDQTTASSTAAPATTQAPVVVEPGSTTTTEAGATPTTAAPTSDTTPSSREQVASATISLSSKLNTLDPAAPIVQPDIITQYLIAGRLFRLNDDFSVVPELADSYEWSADSLTLTIEMKDGLQYSDGTSVLASDVVFAYERQRDLPGPQFSAFLGAVESATAPDDTTVVFSLATPDIDLLGSLGSMVMGIHPQEMIENDPDYFKHPVSAGPYVVVDWTPGESSWVLEENPNYVRGAMSVKQLTLSSIADMTSRVLQLSTGQIDYVYDLPVAASASFPDEVTTTPVPINGQYHLVFNMALPDDHPLRDANVRKAISLAIDRTEVNEKAFQGISTPATEFAYPANPYGREGLFGPQDLDAARAALAASAFAGGFKVELQTWGARAGWTDASLVMAENLGEIGIEVEVTPIEDAVAVANLAAGTYEFQFSGNAAAPLQFFKILFVPGNWWADQARYDNPEVTALINEASGALTVEARAGLLELATDIAAIDLAFVPISERVVLTGNRLPGVIVEANLPPGNNPWISTLGELNE